MIRPGALALALSLAASVAGAQDAPVTTAPPPAPDVDLIGAVLDDPGAYSTDVEEEDEAPQPPPAEAPAPLASPQPQPIAPPPRPRPAPALDRPVLIDETGKTPEGPLAPQELGYDMRMRGAIANAQGRQGPLDGGWTVAAADGAKLYSLQLVDPGDGAGTLEGAWRSLQRHGLGTTGLIASLERGASSLTVRFTRRGPEDVTVLILQTRADGAWSGQMWEDGKVMTVSMVR